MKTAFDEAGGHARSVFLRQVQAGHEILQFLFGVGPHFRRYRVGFEPGFISNMIVVHEIDRCVGKELQRRFKGTRRKIRKVGRHQYSAIVGPRSFFDNKDRGGGMVEDMIDRRAQEKIGNIVVTGSPHDDQVATQL